MLKHYYTDYTKHKKEHNQFIKDFKSIKKEYHTHGVSSYLVIQVQNKVCNWLRTHIVNEDKKIDEFVKANMLSLPAAV